jgi:ABC-type transport system involved in multi-copper enzyme maturation permease subunit
MTGRIFAIALNTFREAVRNKILYVALGVVVAANLLALVLGEMSLAEEARVARDVGLGGVSIFGALTAIYIGVTLLYTEISRRTIHVILAKPIQRFEFVLGKYLGMVITLTLLVAAFGVAMTALLSLAGVSFDGNVAKALLLGWLEVLIVAAVANFFSSFSTPFLSGVFTLALFVIGRSWAELEAAATRSKDVVIRVIASAATYVVPDLHLYSVSGSEVAGKHVSVHAEFVPWAYVGHAAIYAAAVIGVLLLLSMAIFHRRDFL